MEAPEEYPDFFVECSPFGFVISDREDCEVEELEITICTE